MEAESGVQERDLGKIDKAGNYIYIYKWNIYKWNIYIYKWNIYIYINGIGGLESERNT